VMTAETLASTQYSQSFHTCSITIIMVNYDR
jgi:hypothetical protein